MCGKGFLYVGIYEEGQGAGQGEDDGRLVLVAADGVGGDEWVGGVEYAGVVREDGSCCD